MEEKDKNRRESLEILAIPEKGKVLSREIRMCYHSVADPMLDIDKIPDSICSFSSCCFEVLS